MSVVLQVFQVFRSVILERFSQILPFLQFLCSINNKLQQKEAAAGVLEYAMKHHRSEVVSENVFYVQLM